MNILDLNAISKAQTKFDPYDHFIGSNSFHNEMIEGLSSSFPELDLPGFFPKDDIRVDGLFRELMAELESEELSEVVGEKLGLPLSKYPRLIGVRKWSAGADGRIHTDSKSKIATILFYLNENWAEDAPGKLRVLRGPKDFNVYEAEISPVMGSFFGFKRSENSWHGHLPFEGERRVIQVTWLTDDSKLKHKQSTSRFTAWLKRLSLN